MPEQNQERALTQTTNTNNMNDNVDEIINLNSSPENETTHSHDTEAGKK